MICKHRHPSPQLTLTDNQISCKGCLYYQKLSLRRFPLRGVNRGVIIYRSVRFHRRICRQIEEIRDRRGFKMNQSARFIAKIRNSYLYSSLYLYSTSYLRICIRIHICIRICIRIRICILICIRIRICCANPADLRNYPPPPSILHLQKPELFFFSLMPHYHG